MKIVIFILVICVFVEFEEISLGELVMDGGFVVVVKGLDGVVEVIFVGIFFGV